MLPATNPVFITARYRSGSTALWNVFKRIPDCVSYYEPCQANLLANIRHMKPMASHRNVDSYWDEYFPLLGRIEHVHQPEFGFDRLLMEADDDHPALERYLRFLIAEAGDRRPVLQFNRVDFRLPWLRARFPEATLIHLQRNPRSSWVSSRRHLPPELWDDPDHHDAFELMQWSMSLSEVFPFLIEASIEHSYQRHWLIWRLSQCMGQRRSDLSIDFDRDLQRDPKAGMNKLVDIGALPAEHAAHASMHLVSVEPMGGLVQRSEEWFAKTEREGEALLHHLGLIEHFGHQPLAEIQHGHADAWRELAQRPKRSAIKTLLNTEALHRREQTRLLDEVRALGAEV